MLKMGFIPGADIGHDASNHRARAKARMENIRTFVATDGEGTGNGAEHRYVLLATGDKSFPKPDGAIQWWEAFHHWYYDGFMKHPEGTVYIGFFLGYDFTQVLRTLSENRAYALFGNPRVKKATDARREELAEKRPIELKRHAVYEKRQRKNSGGNNTPFPVNLTAPNGDRWLVDILPPMKRLKIKPVTCKTCKGFTVWHCEHTKKNDWMYINDAGPFFQTAFLNVIDPEEAGKEEHQVCTPEEFEIIKRGKDKRSEAVLDADMQEYNLLENEILSRVMDKLNINLTKIGVRLKANSWYGPGAAAEKWIADNTPLPRTPKEADLAQDHKPISLNSSGTGPKMTALSAVTFMSNVPASMQAIGRKSYYGGWFEIMCHGKCGTPVYEYDINSAYPHQISQLPCLEHGTWDKGKNAPNVKPGNYYMVEVTTEGSNEYIGGLPYRTKKGGILRPRSVKGIYWLHEVQAAQDAGLIDRVDYHQWWEYTPCKCPSPFAAIPELYQLRREAKKNKDVWLAAALKLVYNSIYGKLAQSEGEPKYSSPIYASLITAGCRTQILRAIATHPDGASAVAMVATDGVYFFSPHPDLEKKISGNLGEWSGGECSLERCPKQNDPVKPKHNCGVKNNLVLFKPGVYWDDKILARVREKGEASGASLKSRGINARAFSKVIEEITELFDVWPKEHTAPEFPCMTIDVDFSMITCTQALQQGHWKKAGEVTSRTVKQDADMSLKRTTLMGMGILTYDPVIKAHRSRPYNIGETGLESTPYDKTFGWDAAEAREEELGTSEAGKNTMLARDLLHG